MKTAAYFSEDRHYRYWLTRVWDDSKPMMCVIGVNPSTADETVNDPTIRKCRGFAMRLGFGGLLMLNVGAYRATDPREWHKAADPFGPGNSVGHIREYIAEMKRVTLVVAAWGTNCSRGTSLSRAQAITHSIPSLMCWGQNSDSSPRHPLMLPYSTPLELFGDEAVSKTSDTQMERYRSIETAPQHRMHAAGIHTWRDDESGTFISYISESLSCGSTELAAIRSLLSAEKFKAEWFLKNYDLILATLEKMKPEPKP